MLSTIHLFTQQWRNGDMVTSTGKPINHKHFILNLLAAIQLSAKVAICKCAALTKGPVTLGNHKAYVEAKKAAIQPLPILAVETSIQLGQKVLKNMQ